MSHVPTLKVVVGPTASGKSSYAIEIAQRMGGEVVNADSRQLYREVSIGVAKPVFERVEGDVGYAEGVAHHLFFDLSPSQRASVADYQRRAYAAIDAIIARGHVPILVGGTGYYVQAVVDAMQYAQDDISEDVARVSSMALEDMLAELRVLDARAYQRVDRANPRRVASALVRARRGMPDVRRGAARYEADLVGVRAPMDVLEQRIFARIDGMLAAGLVDEVRDIRMRYGDGAPVLDSIGYREVLAYLRGEVSCDEMRSLIGVHTRQYARRQMQWFSRDKRIVWIELS